MYDEQVLVSDEDAKEHEKLYGGYNDLPLGFVEVTEAEFTQKASWGQCIEKIESRQPTNVPEFHDLIGQGLRLFYMNDSTGFAMGCDYWAKKMRYFLFGCRHEYSEVSVGRCLHRWTCKKCGFSQVVDSSD